MSKKVTFQIIEKLKTNSLTRIEIFTGISDADCGLNFSDGQEWYVFTTGNHGKSWASLCGRSALLSQHSILNSIKKYYRKAVNQYKKDKARAQKEIRFIRKLRLPGI